MKKIILLISIIGSIMGNKKIKLFKILTGKIKVETEITEDKKLKQIRFFEEHILISNVLYDKKGRIISSFYK